SGLAVTTPTCAGGRPPRGQPLRASGPTRLTALKDLHHFLGHQQDFNALQDWVDDVLLHAQRLQVKLDAGSRGSRRLVA
ncbi:MAG: hypothetical protein J0L58_17270, partial [Burkholderiales bacterium]|nr:hypothetical protein [Burkholderiales bacterium]